MGILYLNANVSTLTLTTDTSATVRIMGTGLDLNRAISPKAITDSCWQ